MRTFSVRKKDDEKATVIGVVIEYGSVVILLVDHVDKDHHLAIEAFPFSMWDDDTRVYMTKYKWYCTVIESYISEMILIDGFLNELCKTENYE